MGYLIENGFDCVTKVVTKKHRDEKLGSVCLKDGKPCVLEYTEIPDQFKDSLMDGNICIHAMIIHFFERMAKVNLSYHEAKKKIRLPDGTWVNGIKKEKFIFDVFPIPRSLVCSELFEKMNSPLLKC